MPRNSGSSSYATQVDLRPGRNLLVNVNAAVDPFTGDLTWYFTSIDPATGQPPTNPLEGFLPPNVTPPEGEGGVLFTVAARPLPDGTVIRNRATVGFDDGIPVETPEWLNTVDATPPESHVLPLPANEDSASFTLRWEAVGSPADLLDFSVYVSEDGGEFRVWRLSTTATADTFTAPGGHTYSFYSVARDSCGNLEAAPASPDAHTYSRVAVEDASQLQLALEGARPNPATEAGRVWFALPSWEPAVLEVVDIAGRRLLTREVGALGPGWHSLDLSGSVGRPGLYFLRLSQAGRLLRTRMVIIG
jgi:hypothetical protein